MTKTKHVISNLEQLRELVESRNATLISTKYPGALGKVEIICENKHIWSPPLTTVKRGYWCSECGILKKKAVRFSKAVALAEKRGGRCLGEQPETNDSAVNWKCRNMHKFAMSPNEMLGGWWCETCIYGKLLSIEDMNTIAEFRGGKCLSERYEGQSGNLDWQCIDGHRWKCTPSKKKLRAWCQQCRENKPAKELERIMEIAEAKGGKCLSKEYLNKDAHLIFSCGEGHIWSATPHNIKHGNWCNRCIRQFRTIEDIKELAKERGGACISENFLGMNQDLSFVCEKGHAWDSSPGNLIYQGQWCLKCAGKEKGTIEEMRELAKSRGGKCLSEKYVNARTHLNWECADGHSWKATPGSVKYGSWCGDCQISFGEELCRIYFEALFEKSFPRTRPSFLKLGNNQPLQLDGFCEELKIAFEHQGIQHYRAVSHFHRTETAFEDLKRRDRQKAEICKSNDITLIVIPEIPQLTKYEEVLPLIKEQLVQNEISIFRDINADGIDINLAFHQSALRELRNIAKSKRGKLISDTYLGGRIPLWFRCGKGHVFEKLPERIRIGSWCGECAPNKKLSIEDMHKLAASRNGRCLSVDYEGNHVPLIWQCDKYHEPWRAAPADVKGTTKKKGSWCPECANIIRGQKIRAFHSRRRS